MGGVRFRCIARGDTAAWLAMMMVIISPPATGHDTAIMAQLPRAPLSLFSLQMDLTLVR
jgi:hypothetical protein